MKKLLFLGLLIFSLTMLPAQNYVSFFTTVKHGETFTHDNIDIEFIEVISDSRCPVNVNCVRAGEAKVKIRIYKNNKLFENMELIIPASGAINEKASLIYNSKAVRIQCSGLWPYPQSPDRIPKQDYYLEVKIN